MRTHKRHINLFSAVLAVLAIMSAGCTRIEEQTRQEDAAGVILYDLASASSEGVKSSIEESRELGAITLTSADGSYSLTLTGRAAPTSDCREEAAAEATKAAPVTSTNIESRYNDGSIQILALKDGTSEAYIPQQKLVFANRESGSSTSRWKTVTDYTWPEEALEFWSWAPYSGSASAGKLSDASVSGGSLTFSYECPSSASEGKVAEAQSDVLLAYSRHSSSDKGNVSLMYKHALSAVCFKVDRANKCTVKSVSLSNVYSKGSCSFDGSTITWSNLSEPKEFTETFNTPIDEYLKDDYANPQALDKSEDGAKTFLLIPQSATDEKKVTMTLVVRLDGATEDLTLSAELSPSGAIWEPGWTYTYSLCLGKSKIIYHWNDSGIPTHSKTHTGASEIFESIDYDKSGTYEITLHEPLWEPESMEDYYKFAGWAKTSTATEAEYVQKGRSETEGLPYLIDLHSEFIDLYAVWQKVDNPGSWIDYQAYKMNAFAGFRFDHIDSWEFNKSFAFTSSVSKGFEKIGFPIHNLEVGRWYTITFSEDLLPHEKAYNPQSGVYGNTVHKSSDDIKPYNKESMITYTTDATAKNPVIHAWTHTVSDNTWGADAVHVPMSNQQTTFYASAETMWWIWDLSKILDSEKKQYHFSHAKIEMMSEPTGPAIDFRNASFHGFKFKAFNGDEEDKSYSSADNKGRSTYKVKSDFTSSEMKMWGTGSYEKINIPLINLEPGATYKLSFNYTLEALYCSDTPINWPNNDFCFGVRPEKNTKTDKGNFKDTEGYSSFITTNIADCQNKYMEMTFTVPADKNTMYFIWSLSGLSDHTFFHQLITNAKLEKL